MSIILHLTPFRPIHEVKHEFNVAFPFLRLDFYRVQESETAAPVKRILGDSMPFKAAGLNKEGILHVHNAMTVAELEAAFRRKFHLIVQVARQSGNVWLETTMTDDWTLEQQNEHGREITEGMPKESNAAADFDLDRSTL